VCQRLFPISDAGGCSQPSEEASRKAQSRRDKELHAIEREAQKAAAREAATERAANLQSRQGKKKTKNSSKEGKRGRDDDGWQDRVGPDHRQARGGSGAADDAERLRKERIAASEKLRSEAEERRRKSRAKLFGEAERKQSLTTPSSRVGVLLANLRRSRRDLPRGTTKIPGSRLSTRRPRFIPELTSSEDWYGRSEGGNFSGYMVQAFDSTGRRRVIFYRQGERLWKEEVDGSPGALDGGDCEVTVDDARCDVSHTYFQVLSGQLLVRTPRALKFPRFSTSRCRCTRSGSDAWMARCASSLVGDSAQSAASSERSKQGRKMLIPIVQGHLCPPLTRYCLAIPCRIEVCRTVPRLLRMASLRQRGAAAA
jgi:hypothetical protein